MELFQSKSMWPWFFKDIFYKEKIGKNIDRVVTYSNEEKIYNINTIRISNGIIVGKPPEVNEEMRHSYRKTVNFLAVAQFQKSHGYERVIEGLAQYNKNPK